MGFNAFEGVRQRLRVSARMFSSLAAPGDRFISAGHNLLLLALLLAAVFSLIGVVRILPAYGVVRSLRSRRLCPIWSPPTPTPPPRSPVALFPLSMALAWLVAIAHACRCAVASAC